MNQYRLTCDASDILASHAKMTNALLYEIDAAMLAFSEFALNEVKAHLKATIQRPNESDGTLDSAITSEFDDVHNSRRIGIGNKQAMYKVAPYWALINDGGPISSNYVPGFFVDATGQRVRFDAGRASTGLGHQVFDKFVYTPGQKSSYMVVHNEIKPHQFFERGERSIEPYIDKYFGAVLKKAGLWL